MAASAKTGTPVVLVVEDELFVRTDIVDQLKSAGFEVLEAGSGETALEFAENGHGVDVLFTDIRLGGALNGWDVGEAFRSMHPHIGVLYTSGASIDPPREVANSRFFAKPYRAREVVQACRELSDNVEPARAAHP